MPRMLLAIAIAASACGHGAGTATSGACDGLDLHDCRLAQDCTPDICDGCGCAATYRGCLSQGATPAMCPALGCPSGVCCSADEACASGTGSCTTPGATLGCGACNPASSTCTTDADCKAATQICDPVQCSCNGAFACVLGCTDNTTCPEGTMCDVSRARCVDLACTDASQCPANFGCELGGCVRQACNSDEDCAGYCVEGACYAGRGSCQLPVP